MNNAIDAVAVAARNLEKAMERNGRSGYDVAFTAFRTGCEFACVRMNADKLSSSDIVTLAAAATWLLHEALERRG